MPSQLEAELKDLTENLDDRREAYEQYVEDVTKKHGPYGRGSS